MATTSAADLLQLGFSAGSSSVAAAGNGELSRLRVVQVLKPPPTGRPGKGDDEVNGGLRAVAALVLELVVRLLQLLLARHGGGDRAAQRASWRVRGLWGSLDCPTRQRDRHTAGGIR